MVSCVGGLVGVAGGVCCMGGLGYGICCWACCGGLTMVLRLNFLCVSLGDCGGIPAWAWFGVWVFVSAYGWLRSVYARLFCWLVCWWCGYVAGFVVRFFPGF